MRILENRTESVFKQSPGYTKNVICSQVSDSAPIRELPDTLRGEQWAFVQVPFLELKKEMKKIVRGEIFGSTPNVNVLSKSIEPDTLIPGIVVISCRAFPLAAWTDSHEIAAISTYPAENCLVVEFGINERWRYGRYRPNEAAIKEAQAWESAKRRV